MTTLQAKTKNPRRHEVGLVLMTGMLVVMMVTLMALVFIAKRVAITSKFSMKSRYLQEVKTIAKDPLVDVMGFFNTDWRRDFFDVGIEPGINTYSTRITSPHKVDFSMRQQRSRPANVYRLTSKANNRVADHVNNLLFVSTSTLEAVVSFRQDAPRFEWVFPGPVNLDDLPAFLGGGGTVNRTVYVEGDLTTGTARSEILSGFWVVNGTFTLQGGDSVAPGGQVRCRSFRNQGGSNSGVVSASLYGPPSPGVYVYNPLSADGIDYYENNASSSIFVAGGNVDFDFTTFATVADRWKNPEIIIGGVSFGFYPLAMDRNVLVVRGADNVRIIGANTQVSYPLVIVALRDGNPLGGNIVVQGGFNPYSNVEGAITPIGPRTGAFSFQNQVTLAGFGEHADYDVSLAFMAERDLTFDGSMILVGLYYAGGNVSFSSPPGSVVSLTGTVYGLFSNVNSPGSSLTVTADPGLGVYAPKFMPRRPGVASFWNRGNR